MIFSVLQKKKNDILVCFHNMYITYYIICICLQKINYNINYINIIFIESFYIPIPIYTIYRYAYIGNMHKQLI